MSKRIQKDFQTIFSEYITTSLRPSDYIVGTYTNEGLKTDQDQLIFLELLLVPKEFTDYEQEITVKRKIQDETGIEREIEEDFTVTVHNKLQDGDRLILIKKEGGQQYLVIGRCQ